MIPLTAAVIGEENIIGQIGGEAEAKKHLADLGFVVGGTVTVISTIAGNLVVNAKGSRVGIGREMAQKIFIL
ncbi:MAG: ferrous iron transport protein A [Clostridia bacterium]|nr:ferrous iron transport protein A [Clostridia bacterium]